MKNIIPYSRQSINQDDQDAVAQVLGGDYLTTGPAVEGFEAKLCEITNAKYAVACVNGTAALHLACLALGIKKGDFGVTSPVTFLASANCIEYCSGMADFVDIDSSTLCISAAGLERYCREKKVPSVVIPVDFAGVPADLPAIWSVADKYGFRVIEDAAHAFGSSYNHGGSSYQCGGCAHSDVAIFSFHPVKAITTGEGGAVLTNDPRLAAKLRLFRNHGMTKDPDILKRNDGPWYYEMHEMGYNYRLTDIQCALGLSQCNRLKQFKNRRQEIVKMYNKAFQHNPGLKLPPWPKETSPCFHLYCIRFNKGPDFRLEAYEELKKVGIFTQVHYFPVHLQPYYQKKYGFKEGDFKEAEEFYSRCLSLPLYPSMSNDDVGFVIDNIRRVIL